MAFALFFRATTLIQLPKKDPIFVNNGRKFALDVSFILYFEVYEFITELFMLF